MEKGNYKKIFTRIATFKFDCSLYEIFIEKNDSIAFLKINNQGKYEFPTYDEFDKLVKYFSNRKNSTLLFHNGNHFKCKFIPCINFNRKKKLATVMLSSMLILSTMTGCSYPDNNFSSVDKGTIILSYEGENPNTTEITPASESNYGFVETEDYELLESSKIITLYNNKYFDILFGDNIFPEEELNSHIETNSNIPSNFKSYISQYIIDMHQAYSSLDFRGFNYNLSGLNFVFKKTEDIVLECGGLAYYDEKTNTMVVSEEIDLESDPLSIVIFRHELGHLFNNFTITKDGYTIKYNFNNAGRGRYVKEGLDVILTTNPFMSEYPLEIQENMGYPITTNILRVMIDSLPNYEIEDSVSHNVFYLQNKLNEIMQDDIEASIIIELLEMQWMEYADGTIEVSKDDYEDLYGYVARLYLKANVTENMSQEEILNLSQILKERLCIGVDPKKIDMIYVNIIDEVFANYLNENYSQKKGSI